ncbi:hypothetical protein O7626_35350 [Micromonospora sp. WMMD1102]|uniref:hypothetical protein n=1 Tax=Micromonospora sp. WMMD1102 TaxID=3016105 RepID=UPI00241562A6|nr:hypothetical protein [Micromonospora sp. WMMD1102]MDG4791122.1 hypothetical protein [Micromonospora sp. WMMD1102]
METLGFATISDTTAQGAEHRVMATVRGGQYSMQGQGTPAQGQLVVHASYSGFARVMAGPHAVGPIILVNGQPTRGRWGANVFMLPPGHHRIGAKLRQTAMGRAEVVVSVAPGTCTHLYYRAPMTAFGNGDLGSVVR